jgi:hypothetical protein
MADLTSTTVAANYNKFAISQSDAGRELVVKFSATNMTNAQVLDWVRYLTTSHGSSGTGDSAFTVAAIGTADGSAFVSGTTDIIFMRLQGTGSFTDATVEALSGTPTVDIIAIFQPAL